MSTKDTGSQPVFNFGIFGNAGNFGNHEISWLK
jgi:hypothetical protein